MSRSQVRNTIVKRLIASGLFPLARIDLPNKTFSIPTDNDPWCRVTFTDGTSDTRGIGGTDVPVRFERQARYRVTVFTRQAQGSEAGLDLAEAVADLYEKQTGDRPIYYLSPDVFEIGIDPQGWMQHAAQVSYRFDVVK